MSYCSLKFVSTKGRLIGEGAMTHRVGPYTGQGFGEFPMPLGEATGAIPLTLFSGVNLSKSNIFSRIVPVDPVSEEMHSKTSASIITISGWSISASFRQFKLSRVKMSKQNNTLWVKIPYSSLHKVTIRPGFPRTVLFFWVLSWMPRCPGFCPVFEVFWAFTGKCVSFTVTVLRTQH